MPPASKGSIPAWAGETRGCGRSDRSPRVYPRVGGGNPVAVASAAAGVGLSPRGRGKLGGQRALGGVVWSIPAWAGETSPIPSLHARLRVYPRVGGGNLRNGNGPNVVAGLSPRGRGKHMWEAHCPPHVGSIPAWAGETRSAAERRSSGEVYPRVGGGNTYSATAVNGLQGLSPRGRGKPEEMLANPEIERSIPAWAGETRKPFALPCHRWVYPRVGGGNRIACISDRNLVGLSPRGRGKH